MISYGAEQCLPNLVQRGMHQIEAVDGIWQIVVDTIWWGELYLTNGSGHNQILTILYEIFNFHILRKLEAYWGVSESQLPCLDKKELYFVQQMGAATNTIKLIWWYRITESMMDKFFHVELLNSIF